MEEPNGQERNYNPVLKLPRLRPPDSTLKRSTKPPSPKDVTPIIVNGSMVSREDITPIVDQSITISDKINKIDLIENPNAIHSILADPTPIIPQTYPIEDNNYPSQIKVLESIPTESLDPFMLIRPKENQSNTPGKEENDLSESDNEANNKMVPYTSELDVKNYRKFNPPFPSDTPKLQRPIAAFLQSVESTDTSDIGSHALPKVTSPTDNLSLEIIPNPYRTQDFLKKEREERERETRERREREEREERERERREREERERESRERERREREERERESRERREREDREIKEKERREREDREAREREVKERETRERKEKEEPLTHEDLITRAHDCFLKYQILQKSWQEYKFPNLDESMVNKNPQVIIDTYNKSVERIQIDMDVNQYKIALIIMFLVIEVVCVKFMGLDAGGYTLSQIKAMNRYEKLLIEIGEKKMMIGGDSWPPEVRILFIGLMNCGLFILMKYLSSVLGPELVGYISPIVNGLFSGALDNSKTANLPDEIPQRQQDMTGMMGSVASLAAKALSGNQSTASTNIPPAKQQRASRRPIYRE
jgi:hypothetical protein